MWETIMDELKLQGFETYAPSMHVGECKSKYIVVKPDGESQFKRYSTSVRYYTILCYVPQNRFSTLEPFVDSVKKAMENLKPAIMQTGLITPPFYDDTNKSHMVSIQYRNYYRNINV